MATGVTGTVLPFGFEEVLPIKTPWSQINFLPTFIQVNLLPPKTLVVLAFGHFPPATGFAVLAYENEEPIVKQARSVIAKVLRIWKFFHSEKRITTLEALNFTKFSQ